MQEFLGSQVMQSRERSHKIEDRSVDKGIKQQRDNCYRTKVFVSLSGNPTKRMKKLQAKDTLEFFNEVMVEQPLAPLPDPLGLFAWFVERRAMPFSNWVPS